MCVGKVAVVTVRPKARDPSRRRLRGRDTDQSGSETLADQRRHLVGRHLAKPDNTASRFDFHDAARVAIRSAERPLAGACRWNAHRGDRDMLDSQVLVHGNASIRATAHACSHDLTAF
jgi:hypothetical protein